MASLARKLWPFRLSLGVALPISALLFAKLRPGNLDDAFILLVYIRHFAESGSTFTNEPMAASTAFEIVQVEAVRARYLGASTDPLYSNPVDDELLQARFVPASVRACGRWFNFWIRSDRAAGMRESSSFRIGSREPQLLVMTRDEALDAAGVSVERTGLQTIVRLRRLPKLETPFEACSVGILTPGAGDVVATWDGILLARWLDSPRHVIHPWLLDPAKEHRLVLERKGSQSVPLAGVFLDCAHRPPWEPQ